MENVSIDTTKKKGRTIPANEQVIAGPRSVLEPMKMNKSTTSASETTNVGLNPTIFRRWWTFLLILFGTTLSAAPIEVSDLAGLQTIIDNGFVDDGMIRMHPPGAAYNETLPMVSMGSAFPASFLQNAEATTQYGINRYTIEVSESENQPYTRTWTSTNGEVLHTSTPPAGYDPQTWVLTNFPPPDYLDPVELAGYVHDRRPGRRTLHKRGQPARYDIFHLHLKSPSPIGSVISGTRAPWFCGIG